MMLLGRYVSRVESRSIEMAKAIPRTVEPPCPEIENAYYEQI